MFSPAAAGDGSMAFIASSARISAAFIPTRITAILTSDGTYNRVTAEPSQGGEQSRDGAWWELAGSEVQADYNTRDELTESNVSILRTSLRTGGYAEAGDGGGALYKRVGSEPSHEGKVQSLDGAWWEIAETIFTLEMFGGGVDKTGAENNAAFSDIHDVIGENPVSSSNYRGGATIQLNYGVYDFAETIQVKRGLIIQGRAGAEFPNPSTVLSFPASITGIIVHRYNTLNDEIIDPTTYGGDGTIIRDLALFGDGGDQGETVDDTHGMLGHGIWLRSRAVLENLYVKGFACNGVHIRASASGTDATEGNANNWRIVNCKISNNRWCGLYVNGADANAGVASGLDVASNRLWGINDNSFLGNTYLGCHAATNGGLAKVSHGGFRYNFLGGDGSVEPGTDSTIWFSQGAGGVHALYPAWDIAGTYERGGPFRLGGDSARGMLLNCYSESDQAYSEVIAPNMVVGGLHAADFVNTDGVLLHADDLINVINIESRTLALTNSASAITELASLYNSGGRAVGRGGRYAIYAGQNVSDGSQRFAGGLYANCTGSTDSLNSAVGLEYYDGTAQASAVAVEFNGNTKTAVSDGDQTWTWGTFAKRWLKGWFGNISLFPAASVTPANNGEVTFQLTSNTSLTFKVKGSDGTVRSGSVALS